MDKKILLVALANLRNSRDIIGTFEGVSDLEGMYFELDDIVIRLRDIIEARESCL